MEIWLNYYLSFAISGALLAWWSIFLPSLHLLCAETEGDHPVLRSQFVSGLIWISIAAVAIPILIIPLLRERSRINFIVSLTQGFLHKS